MTELQSAFLSGEATRKGQVLGGKHFLATKVVPPRCPGLIDRPRLLALASGLPARRLAVSPLWMGVIACRLVRRLVLLRMGRLGASRLG